MKNLKKLIFGISILGVFTLSSCKLSIFTNEYNATTTEVKTVTTEDYSVPEPDIIGSYNVTFICNNGYVYKSKTNSSNKVLRPDNPEKICATFKGWYTDSNFQNEFDFTRAVTKDITLYAKFDIDYVSLVNLASREYMKSNIRLLITNYERTYFGNQARNASTALGSGVIFYESGDYYYALTNNHVVYTDKTFQEIIIEDAYENEYSATLIANDANYDLAIVRFQKSTDLLVAEFSNYDINKDELVLAFGEPNGLSNTLSMGYILGNKVFDPDKDTLQMSNVNFNVYMSSAPIDSGSSGGGLYDSNLKLIGINFASAVDNDTKEYKYTYSIPLDKVREFISSKMRITL